MHILKVRNKQTVKANKQTNKQTNRQFKDKTKKERNMFTL